MILVSDVGKKEDILSPSLIEKFNEIKPSGNITETEARDFWDQIFDNFNDVYDDAEAQIASEVYGRSEDEFSFDFDFNESGLQKLLVRFDVENWEKLSVLEKETLVKEFSEILGQKISIENPPKLEFYNSSSCNCGAFDPVHNVISINRKNFDNPAETIDTIAHEMWHAYQYQRAQKLETYMDYLYAYNFDNYIVPYIDKDGYVNFIDYQDQLIEAEARSFAGLFADKCWRTST